ncbi:MAG: SDR family oxidoreductase [Leptolyngbyaceae cyanobacterium CSU_1_3]|nr:SDR family oxidoreductase [Leptolyngbyaceae cyanobacterium CSU_1_3]
MKILVTGATGFVGSALVRSSPPNTEIYGVVRSSDHNLPEGVTPVLVNSLLDLTARADVLSEMDCIVHLAARVHVMHDTVSDPLAAFRAVNTEATKELAIAAARSGVRRFVYLSSIKVNGEGQPDDALASATPYSELSKPTPHDPYGISKWEAECLLHQVAIETGLEVAILRPPLVYGAGVKANFRQLMKLVKLGVPLPFGRVKNARSLVYVGNLVDAIFTCALHPAAVGQTFLVSDGVEVSTPDLIQHLATALGCPARLLPVPPEVLKLLGQMTGKSAAIDRLLGSLAIDSRKLGQTLNWQPPFSLQQGLKVTADEYLQSVSHL